MNDGRSTVNQAPAFPGQDSAEILPDPLNNVRMASLAKVGIRYAVRGGD